MTNVPPPCGLSAEDWDALRYTLNWILAPETKVYAFGSRVHGRNVKPFSDLDLALAQADGTPYPFATWALLAQKLADCPTSIRLDVVDYYGISPEFRAKIDAENQPLIWQKVFGSTP